MPKVAANGVELFYEETGAPDAPALILIMGLGTQMIAWPDDFVAGLAARGFRVIRYDNRDIGLSTSLDGAPAPSVLLAVAAARFGLPLRVAYTLSDMARDAVALMDALGIDRAHVVGASMGGMIAQLVAAEHPGRVLSLTSIMSSSGARGLPGPSSALRRRLMARRPANATRDQLVAAGAQTLEMISYPDPARPADAFRIAARKSMERGYNPLGMRRQLLAIIADRSRVDRLARIMAPTLVIHGRADPLVPLAAGEDTARRIAGARLEVIDQMAHDLPPSQSSRLVDLIAAHASAAGPSATG
ncbi:MAG TPA: alpha/beta hydrolase [Sphingomonas sp.]|nr:alpha/beta hydrolase [Sphingomonas sp.]